METVNSDLWSEWLLNRRHGNDPAYQRLVQTDVLRFADRLLDAAGLVPGMTLADIGTGEGLIAFRAIERVGPTLRVLLTDISAPLLRHTEQLAVQRNVLNPCTVVVAPADQLRGLPDASVDVVITRSVLAYVSDKRAAFREFHRILKPGGRISLGEPIFQDDAYKVWALRNCLDATPPESRDRFLTLLHRWQAAQLPDTEDGIAANPLTNYTERDLMRFAHDSGFADLHMELHIDVIPSDVTSWEVFIGIAPHPLAPPLSVIFEEQFSAEDRAFFEAQLRPAVEAGRSITTERMIYLSARKA